MNRIRSFILGTAALSLFSCAPFLERGEWVDETYDALLSVVSDRENRGGYAAFDCDNTSILHDVTHTLMVYQIENLCFAVAPEHIFTDGLERTDFVLDGPGLTAAQMGASLAGEYRHLKARLDSGETLDDIHSDELYLDFRARFLAFYKAIGKNYSYGELCLWEPSLAAGFSREELHRLGKKSIDYSLSLGEARNEEWVSPDGRWRGVAEKGIVVTADMKNLYKSLRRAGITPYIVSASPEWIVELLACDAEKGFGLSSDQVFGVRFDENPDGSWCYRDGYPQPFKEGKVALIDSLIAPRHGGREPVLVAGDSEGDVAMLTAYPQMQVGLIMNQYREGQIRLLASRRDGRYVSQPVCITQEHRLHRYLEQMPSRAGGCYHSYEVAPGVDTPAPKGFKPFYIGHYGRHGSRYHTPKMISRYYPRFLLAADSLGVLTNTGRRVLSRMLEIYRAHEGHSGDLSKRGAGEHLGIGGRMGSRFSEVFLGRDSVMAIATHYPRCRESMQNYLSGLGAAVKLNAISANSGERYFDLLSHEYIGQKELFREINQWQYEARAERIDPSGMQERLFTDGFVPDSIQQVIKGIFIYGCQEEDLDFPEEGRLFSFFTDDELFDQWSIYSDVVYAEMAGSVEYGDRIVPVAKGLLSDIIDKADKAVAGNDVAANLRFGHDNGLVPLLFLMGVEGYTVRAPFDGAWKLWSSSQRTPMASNLHMVFYRNKEGDVLVKLLFNEQETCIADLQPDEGPYYSWNKLKSHLESRVFS